MAATPSPRCFPGLRELRIRAWFLSDEEKNALSPGASPPTPPDGVFVEPVNWTEAPPPASEPKLFESATLGPVGTSGGLVLDDTHFVGVRFRLDGPASVSTIGIHASVRLGVDALFGAVVRLTSLANFPDSLDLSTPDVLGSVLISGTPSSADYSSPMSLTLPPGTYALSKRENG